LITCVSGMVMSVKLHEIVGTDGKDKAEPVAWASLSKDG